MSWIGAWLGPMTATVEPDPPEPPAPIEAAVAHGEPNYVDHVEAALDRLVSQFRKDPWSE